MYIVSISMSMSIYTYIHAYTYIHICICSRAASVWRAMLRSGQDGDLRHSEIVLTRYTYIYIYI